MKPPQFDNTYANLPETFYAAAQPSPAPNAALLAVNRPLAAALGLDADWLESEDGVAMISASRFPAAATPIAMAYGGHQFGGWSPQLGDGRAMLLGEVIGDDGVRYDIQLKGSGRTRFSRSGDGKAGVGPVMREYLVSEAMHALGIPTTRALAAVTTGERIYRQTPEPGAVIARVAQSHVRVGTFQYFYARKAYDSVKTLADYVIDRHYPEARETDNAYKNFFERFIQRQIDLVSRWMTVGFIHGVMNTDNVQIVGETLDFGPCAFIDNFHPDKVFSSIDRNGRYAWGNQPAITQWNLTRLAEAMLSLFDKEPDPAVEWVTATLEAFRETFVRRLNERFRAKLGLLTEVPGHADMVSTTLATLADNEVDFTLFFRHLTNVADGGSEVPLRELFNDPQECDAWLSTWRSQRDKDADPEGKRLPTMRRHNPIFIPRNHRIEEAIQAAYKNDYEPFRRLHKVLQRPFDEQPEHAEYERPPAPEEVVERTFCGT